MDQVSAAINVIRRSSRLAQVQFASPAVMLMPLDDAASALVASGFMRPWLEAKVKEALESGETFTWRKDDSDMATYALATQSEVISLAGQGVGISSPGVDYEKRRRRAADVTYVFNLPAEASARALAFAELTKQGRVLLEVVAESGAESANLSALEAILEPARDKLGFKPDKDVVGLFKNHFKWTYEKAGLARLVGETKEGEDDDAE